MQSIKLEEVRVQVLKFMESLGIQPLDERDIILDGELHRYRTHDDRVSEMSGAYCVYPEGLPAGFVQDWRKGIKETWRYDTIGLDDEQRSYFNSEEFRKKAESERKEAEAHREALRAQRTQLARQLWERLPEAPETHPYLMRKNVKSYGLRYNAETGSLAVPLRNAKGLLMSIQWIPCEPEKHKQFYEGASLKGSYWSAGLEHLDNLDKKDKDTDIVILLGEGFATMSKVHELTGYPVAAAMSCSRLKEIASVLREAYPKSKLVICADNDKGTELKLGHNLGLYEAQSVVKKGLAAGYVYPEFSDGEEGTDWDDYALIKGDIVASMTLRENISGVLQAERRERYERQAEELGILHSEKFSEFVKPKCGVSWLIDGWLPSEGTVMLFAPSGSGKSFLTIDLAFAVACPEVMEWQGQSVLKHGTVIYFAGEGQLGMRKRCAGLAAARGIAPTSVKMYIVSETLSIDDRDLDAGIRRAIANIGMLASDVVMIVFDTTNCYMSGDENKTADATNYLRCCKAAGSEFGCMVYIVNHTGLSQETQNRARGSSAFKAAVDVEMKVSKDGGILTLEMTKSKDSEVAPAKKFRLETVEVPGYFDATGRPETTCVLMDAFDLPEADLREKKPTEAEEFALRTYSEAAKEHGELIQTENGREVVRVRAEDWRKACYRLSSADNPSTKRSVFSRVRKKLVETLQILSKDETDGQEYYSLKPCGNAYELGIITHIHNRMREV